jgi:hypothetical protein
MSCVFIHALRERINTTDVNTLINSDSIVIKNLIKYYDNFLAVDNICVGIPDSIKNSNRKNSIPCTAMNTKYFPHPGYSQAR